MSVNPMDFGAVGDGVTNDGAAVMAAVATGKKVVFPDDKTMLIDGHTITPSSWQEIDINGCLLKKTATADGGGNGSYTNPFIKIHGVENVAIKNGRFYMPPGARRICVTVEASSCVDIEGNKTTGNETFLFLWKGSDRVRVIKNHTKGGQFGMATGGDASGNTSGVLSNLLVDHNIFEGADSEGVDINWDTQNAIITNNFLLRNNRTNAATNTDELDIGGGSINACRDILVANNIIDGGGMSATGITVKMNPTARTQNVTITGNIIKNLASAKTDGAGIRVTRSSHVMVAHNQIYSAYKGISVDTDFSRVWVLGNRVSNTTGDAIYAGTVDQYTRNSALWVRDNMIFAAGGLGLNVRDTNQGDVTGNMLEGSLMQVANCTNVTSTPNRVF